jgi:hypothetical protein
VDIGSGKNMAMVRDGLSTVDLQYRVEGKVTCRVVPGQNQSRAACGLEDGGCSHGWVLGGAAEGQHRRQPTSIGAAVAHGFREGTEGGMRRGSGGTAWGRGEERGGCLREVAAA